MAQDKPIPIANADQANTGGRHAIPEGLYRMWLGPYGSQVYVWADSFEDAFEVMVEWADDNAPGYLTDVGEAELRAAAEDLGIEWEETWLGPYHDYNTRDWIKVQEHAEADLTPIGHTTLKNGQYIPSHEWGGDEVTDKEEIEEVARESIQEVYGHDFMVGDEVIFEGYDRDAGDPDLYTVTSSSGDSLDLESVEGDVAYDNVDASEVKHA